MAVNSTFTLPQLPWAKDSLAPHMSVETIEFHYGKHHQNYVNKLNDLVAGSDLAKHTLEELIKTQTGKVFNNAAQVWNHTFFWNSLKPHGGGEPHGALKEAIDRDFGGFEAFKKTFSDAALNHFGSGWAWLAQNHEGKLIVYSKSDAGTPLTDGHTPILTIDVWEHAYYIDYRNNRAAFIEHFWHLVNWEFAASHLKHH